MMPSATLRNADAPASRHQEKERIVREDPREMRDNPEIANDLSVVVTVTRRCFRASLPPSQSGRAPLGS